MANSYLYSLVEKNLNMNDDELFNCAAWLKKLNINEATWLKKLNRINYKLNKNFIKQP